MFKCPEFPLKRCDDWFFDLEGRPKISQKRSVSSAAAETTLDPSGDWSRCNTRAVCPVNSLSFVIVGYFQRTSWFWEKPWLDTSSLWCGDHNRAQTCDPVSTEFIKVPVWIFLIGVANNSRVSNKPSYWQSMLRQNPHIRLCSKLTKTLLFYPLYLLLKRGDFFEMEPKPTLWQQHYDRSRQGVVIPLLSGRFDCPSQTPTNTRNFHFPQKQG